METHAPLIGAGRLFQRVLFRHGATSTREDGSILQRAILTSRYREHHPI